MTSVPRLLWVLPGLLAVVAVLTAGSTAAADDRGTHSDRDAAPVKVHEDTAVFWGAAPDWRPVYVTEQDVRVPSTSPLDPQDEWHMAQRVFGRYHMVATQRTRTGATLRPPDNVEKVVLSWGGTPPDDLRTYRKNSRRMTGFLSRLMAGDGEAWQQGGLSVYAVSMATRAQVPVPGEHVAPELSQYVTSLVAELSGLPLQPLPLPAVVPLCALQLSGATPSFRVCQDVETSDPDMPWVYVWHGVLSAARAHSSIVRGGVSLWNTYVSDNEHLSGRHTPLKALLATALRGRRAALGLVDEPQPALPDERSFDDEELQAAMPCVPSAWNGLHASLSLQLHAGRTTRIVFAEVGMASYCGGRVALRTQPPDGPSVRVAVNATAVESASQVQQQDVTVFSDEREPVRVRIGALPHPVLRGDARYMIHGTGYHRQWISRIEWPFRDPAGTGDGSLRAETPCRLRMLLLVPAGAYFDLYQLRDLQEWGDLAVTAWRDIDLERFQHSSAAHVVMLAWNATTRATIDGTLVLDVDAPIHLRYHASNDTRPSAVVKMPPPLRVEAVCEGVSLAAEASVVTSCIGSESCDPTQIGRVDTEELLVSLLLCDEYLLPTSQWTPLDVSAHHSLRAAVPVGQLHHRPLVVSVTVAATVGACALLLHTIWHSDAEHVAGRRAGRKSKAE